MTQIKSKLGMCRLRYRHCRGEGKTRWQALRSAVDWAWRYPKYGWLFKKKGGDAT